jgi:hypothetical protein
MSKKLQIFDVVFKPSKHRVVRVLAEDEQHACHLAMGFSMARSGRGSLTRSDGWFTDGGATKASSR